MLTSRDLATGYEDVVAALTRAPAEQRELLLAKTVLLLALRLDSVEELRAVLAAAALDLTDTTTEDRHEYQ